MATERREPAKAAEDVQSSRPDRFRSTRLAHQAETAEDYVELINELLGAQGEARIIDLAERFGVSLPTVTKIVARLHREGLVDTKPYRSIQLTRRGHDLAQRAKRRHETVVAFLRSIGVDETTARIDAEGMEHHVSDNTLKIFEKVIRERRGTRQE
jgi:DtxR family manganese transport transcriptional regulator